MDTQTSIQCEYLIFKHFVSVKSRKGSIQNDKNAAPRPAAVVSWGSRSCCYRNGRSRPLISIWGNTKGCSNINATLNAEVHKLSLLDSWYNLVQNFEVKIQKPP